MRPAPPPVGGLTRPMLVCAAVGVAGLAACLFGALSSFREALHGYLFAFVFWLTFPLGALFTLMTFHASHARWPIVFRRPLEWGAQAVLVFLPLFIPLALGVRELWLWAGPTAALPAKTLALLAHKAPYLNVPFFLLRALGYFVCWGVVALLLAGWSRAQDDRPDLKQVTRSRVLSAGGLPVLALVTSFAFIDWVLSLDPTFGSTIFAIYVWAGAMVAALASLAIAAALTGGPASFADVVTPAHLVRLGTLLFAFVCFWAYCAYSQGMLVWIAGLPAEEAWLVVRSEGPWGAVLVALLLGHFAVPFLLLVPRVLKTRPRALAAIGAGLLVFHALDVYWLIFPALHPAGPALHWTTVTAFLGVGGIASAFTLWVARGARALPVNEPYLPHSLEVPLP